MHKGLDNTLILTLADMLVGNQVDTQAVMHALALICDGGQFDCAMVYEADLSEQFSLKERYAPGAAIFCENFQASELPQSERERLAGQGVRYMEKKAQNTLVEERMLQTLDATAVLCYPLVDEKWHAYGLLILCNQTPKQALSQSDQKTLAALLSMLARYVGMRMYQNKIVQAQRTLESILDNTGIDIYVNDFNNHDILYVNRSMAAPYGGQAAFVGRRCWEVLFPGQNGPCEFCPQKQLVDEEGQPTRVYTWDYQRPFDGSWFRVFSAAFRWVDGRTAHVVSSADITDNKRNEALVEYMANYDQLTKLPNRRMLLRECERRINKATVSEQGYILFFDIDGFKTINDTLGHDAGDEFLVQLGEFFSSIPLLKDSFYRNGGDEFVAVLGGETITKANVQNLASFIHTRFRKPWRLKNGEVYSNTSIGVACFPEDGMTADQLLQRADMAMYRVKKAGGGGICFGYQIDGKEALAN